MTAHYDPTTARWTVTHDMLPFTPAQKRRMNSLRNFARMLARDPKLDARWPQPDSCHSAC
jgi:hypothetical protein